MFDYVYHQQSFRNFASATTTRAPRLAGKVAIITGAAGGIGRQSALLFADEGAQVMCVDMNDKEGKETMSLIQAKHGKEAAMFMKCDVSKAAQVKDVVDNTEKAYGKVNVIFNNAGNFEAIHESTGLSYCLLFTLV